MKISKILISQPAPASPDKSPFTEMLASHKLTADFKPLMKVVGVTAKEFRSQRVDILASTAVIFTSRTTIDNFFRICEENRITIPETMKYFCITEAIALYLQKYIVYRKRKIFFGKSTTSELMDVIMKHKEEKFILALSEPHSQEIPKLLTNAKLKFEKLILAKSVNNDEVGKGSDLANYDMFVVYSRNDINSLLERFDGAPCSVPIAAFGVGTAKAAMEASLDVQVLAPTKESPSMVMALERYMKAYEKKQPIDTSYIDEYIKSAMQNSDQLIAKLKPTRTRKTTSVKSTTVAASKKKVAVKGGAGATE